MRKTRTALLPLILLSLLPLGACKKEKEEPKDPILSDYAIQHDDEFGGAFIKISRDDFNSLGFAFGDSVNLSFSNGAKMKDIGYYSGYYVAAGQELVVGYPGYEFIKFCINYGNDVYDIYDLSDQLTVTITLNEKAKYLTIEETLSISYSDDINQYESREQFANFRTIEAGSIKPGRLYRGASPVDNRRKRAATVDDLLEEHNIVYDIDLADNRDVVESFYLREDFDSPYVKKLDKGDPEIGEDQGGKLLPLGMGAAYKSADFAEKMQRMFMGILHNDGPYYIHCLEGKDRTGYVCMIIEAMCGASYEELIEDYFITYKNYYGIDKEKEPAKYEAIKTIHIDEMIRYAFDYEKSVNVSLLGASDFHSKVNSYLLDGVGLTQEEIDDITEKLTR